MCNKSIVLYIFDKEAVEFLSAISWSCIIMTYGLKCCYLDSILEASLSLIQIMLCMTIKFDPGPYTGVRSTETLLTIWLMGAEMKWTTFDRWRFQMYFLQWKYLNFNKNSRKFVPKGSINNTPVLVQIMAWHCLGDKPFSEPMMVSSPTHMCH